MGRFDGPNFETLSEPKMSIWVGTVPLDEIPDDYLEADPKAGDDSPWTPFSEDFGFGYFDDDLAEGNVSSTIGPAPIEELIEPMSYAHTYSDKVVAAAKAAGCEQTEFIFIIFDFAYDPQVTGISKSKYLTFLGVFDYEYE